MNNSHELNSYEPIEGKYESIAKSNGHIAEGKYEYSKTQLSEYESKYIYVPLSVITDTELDIRRVAVFSYLRIHCGLNNVINFTVSDIVEWCGSKPDRKADGTNGKVLSTLDSLNDRGYLTYLTEKSRSSYMKCKFNMDYYYDDCSDGFAAIYLDELEKIMSYKKANSKDTALNNTTILLAFAFLRLRIRRRPNELKPEERYPENIKSRRERLPEAYSGIINDMAGEMGISAKTLSKIIDILEYDLKLIVTDRAYRVKNEDNEYRTLPTIFANAYKREHGYLLATGDNYSRTEIELKAENMKQHYQDYKIDKRKRKSKRKEVNAGE